MGPLGRIADALKRAEQERRKTLAHAGPESASGQAVFSSPSESAAGLLAAPQSTSTDVPESRDEVRAPVQGLYESLVPFFERSSLVTEQYRALRTRLLSQNPNYEHRTLAITSAVPKEGKSVTTLNLGAVLAEIRHLRVVVVDGDFRRSSLARMLNQSDADGPGLAEVLRGESTLDESLRSTPIPNLSFVAAGRTKGRSAAQLLVAASAAQVFQQMQDRFHYVIVDTPPATTVTDVGIIGQYCSGVIVVVRLNRTVEIAARRAVRLLKVNNIPILGCLIVGRDIPTGRYGYGYGYGYGYNYYRYYDYYEKGADGNE